MLCVRECVRVCICVCARVCACVCVCVYNMSNMSNMSNMRKVYTNAIHVPLKCYKYTNVTSSGTQMYKYTNATHVAHKWSIISHTHAPVPTCYMRGAQMLPVHTHKCRFGPSGSFMGRKKGPSKAPVNIFIRMKPLRQSRECVWMIWAFHVPAKKAHQRPENMLRFQESDQSSWVFSSGFW